LYQLRCCCSSLYCSSDKILFHFMAMSMALFLVYVLFWILKLPGHSKRFSDPLTFMEQSQNVFVSFFITYKYLVCHLFFPFHSAYNLSGLAFLSFASMLSQSCVLIYVFFKTVLKLLVPHSSKDNLFYCFSYWFSIETLNAYNVERYFLFINILFLTFHLCNLHDECISSLSNRGSNLYCCPLGENSTVGDKCGGLKCLKTIFLKGIIEYTSIWIIGSIRSMHGKFPFSFCEIH